MDSPELQLEVPEPEAAQSVPIPAIAAAWGVSRAYVYKLVKKGCPTTTVEAASAWREANAVHNVGSKGKNPSQIENVSGDSGSDEGNTPSPPLAKRVGRKIKLRTVEASLDRAILNEELCAAAVDEATQLGNPARVWQAINSYNKAQANRLETEKLLLKILQERGDLVSSDAVKEMISRAWLPLLARLRSIAKRAAQRANPSDDVLAEMVIAEEIELAIEEGQRSYEEAIE